MTRAVLSAIVCAGGLVGPAAAQELQVDADGLVHMLRARGAADQITAGCRAAIVPDRAAIVGGLTARSLRPSEAHAQLEEQLTAIRALVDEHAGRLVELERVRSVDEPPPTRHAPDPEAAPFVAVQWLEIDLPADVPVDPLLDELLRLGLDRYGRPEVLYARHAAPRVLVLFRFSDLEGALDAIHEDCRRAAWQSWCEHTPDADGCAAAYGAVSDHLSTLSFDLTSLPVPLPNGGATALRFGHPWSPAQLDGVELIGLVPLELGGQIRLSIAAGR